MQASSGAADASPFSDSARAGFTHAAWDVRAESFDSDATVALQLAAGDATALDTLYQRHYEAALAVATALLRDRSAAEDLVHESFLRAWRRASSFHSSRGTFRSWLLTIVRNAAIDQLRQQAMQRRPDIAAAQESLNSSGELDVPAQVLRSLDADRLHFALAQLAPEQRYAVQQAFFSELSHREIAELEGLPLGTVKGRVRLGLHRLRSLLANP